MIDTDKIIQSVDIGKAIEYYTGNRKIHNKYLCPFHNDKHPSLSVKTEKQIWHCWSCDKGGNVINLVRDLYGLSFVDACKKIATDFHIDIQIEEPKKKDTWYEIEAEIRKDRKEELQEVKADIDKEIELLTTAHRVLFRYGAPKELCNQYVEEIEALEELKKIAR